MKFDSQERPTLHAATTNAGKLVEFTHYAATKGIEVHPLPGLHEMPEPKEDAATFMGNAELKAAEYSLRLPELFVMADDSGLEVESLGGLPGVRSARFAQDLGYQIGATRDDRNNNALLTLLQRIPGAMDGVSTHGARYVCALAVAHRGEVLLRAQGTVDGVILSEPRGEGGFGYDPVFFLPREGRTMAELTGEEKWAISHRGRAFRDLLKQI